MKDTKEVEESPVLVSEVIGLVKKCEGNYKQQRVFNRVMALVMAELFAFGRHTITQLLLTLGLTDEDWSSWHRIFSFKRFAEEETSRVMVEEILAEVPETEPFVVGGDGFHVPRCSETMPGTGWMRGLATAKWRPGIQRGQRYVETSWLTPLKNGFSRAIPIRCLPAFTEKSVPCEGAAPRTEVATGLVILTWIRECMDKAGRVKQWLVALYDGSYETRAFWAELPARTVAIVRTARNRCLYHLPGKDAHGNRKYGEQAKHPFEWLKARKGFTRLDVMVRGRLRPMRYRIEGPFVRDGLPDIPLFLIVVGGGKRPAGSRRKSYKPCFFLVNAVQKNGVWSLPLPVPLLLALLWQRWELEVAHRQMKTGLGLGEKQCWNDAATVATIQWSVWIYALIMLSGYRVWKHETGPHAPGLWRKPNQRWSFTVVCQSLRRELWQLPQFRATWTWSRDNWLANESLWDNLMNSVLASARL
ncbi:MAG: hypothetical protein KDE19_06580 [Caldilineaceae bacterium]|nr:hypothetical protein [Caldilineaceae bacterium]